VMISIDFKPDMPDHSVMALVSDRF